MGDAACAPRTGADEEALDALIFDWGEAYAIGRDDAGTWQAARRDRTGHLMTAPDAGELRTAIRANYQAEPVPRMLPCAEGTP